MSVGSKLTPLPARSAASHRGGLLFLLPEFLGEGKKALAFHSSTMCSALCLYLHPHGWTDGPRSARVPQSLVLMHLQLPGEVSSIISIRTLFSAFPSLLLATPFHILQHSSSSQMPVCLQYLNCFLLCTALCDMPHPCHLSNTGQTFGLAAWYSCTLSCTSHASAFS